MIPIEYLWYIIGAISVPVFIFIYLKALKRNRADKARVAMRRKRFERTIGHGQKPNTGKLPATERILNRKVENPASERIASAEINHAVENPAADRKESTVKSVEDLSEEHWLRRVKAPAKRESSPTHWLDYLKPKRSRHWLDNLRR